MQLTQRKSELRISLVFNKILAAERGINTKDVMSKKHVVLFLLLILSW